MGSGMLNKCKCIDCTRRDIGCHSRCEDYKKWKAEIDKIRKAMKEAKADIGYEYREERYSRKLRRKKQYTYK